MRRLAVTGVVVASALAGQPTYAAPAQTKHLAKTRIAFSTRQPAHATGLKLTARFGDPVGSQNKPPRLTRARFVFPKHTRIRTSLRQQCTATDQQLQAEGPPACPARSKVGQGTIT